MLQCPYCPRTFTRGRDLHAHLMKDRRDHDLDYPNFIPRDASVLKLVARARARAKSEREALREEEPFESAPVAPRREISYTEMHRLQEEARMRREEKARAAAAAQRLAEEQERSNKPGMDAGGWIIVSILGATALKFIVSSAASSAKK